MFHALNNYADTQISWEPTCQPCAERYLNTTSRAADDAPGLSDVRAALERLRPYLIETPIHWWKGVGIAGLVGPETRIVAKLELLQRSGSFKSRGVILNMLALGADSLARGVTAVSSGNHAIAVAFAAREFGSSAKVVMLQSANPARVDLCQRLGGEILFAADGASAFELADQITANEGRTLIHPYEGTQTILGAATLGLEFAQQAGPLDAVVIPIGGGGLCAGMAAAIKQANPDCLVFGVEPTGADVMHRSFALGTPTQAGPVQTIADSLGAPFTTPMSYGLCRRFVDELVLIEDDQIRSAMSLIFRELKLAVEPAAAVATAALIAPLRSRLSGLRVGVVICGTNIDFASYATNLRNL
ncbi:MAG TPA: threonine/serine dehydratase [Dehalococcoidia bacterium]|nr:threonine/serine dehydratase [Dehalococcoidia bacterium]